MSTLKGSSIYLGADNEEVKAGGNQTIKTFKMLKTEK